MEKSKAFSISIFFKQRIAEKRAQARLQTLAVKNRKEIPEKVKLAKEKLKQKREQKKIEADGKAKKALLDDFRKALQFNPLPIINSKLKLETIEKANGFWGKFQKPQKSVNAFFIRYELEKFNLFKAFESLICISKINITPFSYQLETAKKVLRQFRGRVLLADEVGLGKTIEAGLILKEYMTRGLAQKILIITPASLVGQWQEEMNSKFNIEF